jgi:purine nucleosidase
MGLSDVPIGIGASETLAGRPVWWAGHEGRGIPDLEGIEVDTAHTAADLLRRAAAEHRGELDLFAIGPLTNIAAAMEADDAFAASLHHLYIMGGAFNREKPEHNIKCDPEAAEIVARSGIPMTFCGLDVTQRVWLREDDLPRIREAKDGIGPLLENQIRTWWTFRGETRDNPHDPLAILTAIRSDLFRFERGEVQIDLDEPAPGRTRLEPRADGSARVAIDVDVPAAEAEIVGRICG